MTKVTSFTFSKSSLSTIKKFKEGYNWPVVYIIHGNNEAYIGETTSAYIRMNQHLSDATRNNLNKVEIITDTTFNKSAILNLESFLIKYMSADNTYKLQNGNAGLQNHNYYQREVYEKEFKHIWLDLKRKNLVNSELHALENTDLFKYSPYKSLTLDQYVIVNDILKEMFADIQNNQHTSFTVVGGAGTGKTILGTYLIKLLTDCFNENTLTSEDNMSEIILHTQKLKNVFKNMNIGLVIPMANLRKTLKKCFREIKGLSSKMVLSPTDVANAKQQFDILIVDEAHRLRRRKNLTQYASYDACNVKLGLGVEGTELDWILKKSQYQVFFYDEGQSIKHTDVRKEDFNQVIYGLHNHRYFLDVQLRCLAGGSEYVEYMKAIFSDCPPTKRINFPKYEIKIFDDINEMVEIIKQRDKEYGLSRNIAGYAWKWNTKTENLNKMSIEKTNALISKGVFDIEIEGNQYIWNSQAEDWIHSPNAINEIGSIHTTQGFDLNYTGLIIGKDLQYDLANDRFIADRSNYYDVKGKSATSDAELLNYLLNIYVTMCLRGMRGTYIYVCDDGLREYLKRYI